MDPERNEPLDLDTVEAELNEIEAALAALDDVTPDSVPDTPATPTPANTEPVG